MVSLLDFFYSLVVSSPSMCVCGKDLYANYSFRCDRILSLGKGMRLLSYGRTELRLSDHRPVTASYVVEVEVFSPRKLQRALTFTDAEIENQEGLEVGYLRSREVSNLPHILQLHKQLLCFHLKILVYFKCYGSRLM